MSLKKDASGRRSIEVEVALHGTPEEVWHAIATGPGISSWFVPSEVEEREGGKVAFHLDEALASTGSVTAWQPPRRFVYEEPGWSPGAPPLATEWLVEARAGGTCVVRVVTSLFTSSNEWDEQLESQEKGWPAFFEILQLMFTHFRGQRCTPVRLMRHTQGPEPEAWERLTRSLGLAGAKPGERRSTPPTGGPTFAGRVERAIDKTGMHEIVLRLEQPAVGLAAVCTASWEQKVLATVNLYFFGDTSPALVEPHAPVWRAWLEGHTAASQQEQQQHVE